MSADELTYADVGVTDPASSEWAAGPHRFQKTVLVGRGEECWVASREALMAWQVKIRSGFQVVGEGGPVEAGRDYELAFRIGPLTVREPIRVVAVVDEPARCGFAYGTRRGHPVSGEEAFIVDRDASGEVSFTRRSLTMPARGWRAVAFPVFITAQRVFRGRYLAALKT